MKCKEAWSECWDPKTEQYFYFNNIIQVRQLDRPEVLNDNLSSSNELSNLEGLSPIERKISMDLQHEKEFRLKRYKLMRSLHKLNGYSKLKTQVLAPKKEGFLMNLNRKTILSDSYKKIFHATITELRQKIKIQFENEDGIDSGALGKEAFLLISQTALIYSSHLYRGWMRELDGDESSKGSLFFTEECNQNDHSMIDLNDNNNKDDKKIKRSIFLNQDELNKLKLNKINGADYGYFFGRFIAKSLFDRQLVEIPLSPILLRHILGDVDLGNDYKLVDINEKDEIKILLDDLKLIDFPLYNSLLWMISNDITGIIYETFSIELENKGNNCFNNSVSTKGGQGRGIRQNSMNINPNLIPLCQNGINKDVTEENKLEYIRLLVRWKTTFSINYLLAPFLKGFHEIIPIALLQEENITYNELNQMLNGKEELEIESLKPYVIYQVKFYIFITYNL
jgi:hypothetical protein